MKRKAITVTIRGERYYFRQADASGDWYWTLNMYGAKPFKDKKSAAEEIEKLRLNFRHPDVEIVTVDIPKGAGE